MNNYKSLTRTTLAQTDNLPNEGIYILAYMGRVIYVGKAETGVAHRLQHHWNNRLYELLGDWMDKLVLDWHNVRLDVLEAPDSDVRSWLLEAEARLVKRFTPLFNQHLGTAQVYDTGDE